jgi:WD40 repeat protein
VILCDAATGKEVRTFAAGDSVVAAAFTPDGKALAAATRGGAVLLWDASSGKRLPQSAGDVHPVSRLQFVEGGKRLVGAGTDLITWDAATGREVRRLPGAWVSTGGAVSPDGKLLATPGVVNWASAVLLRDSSTGKTLRTLQGHGIHPPLLSRFTPDGRRLVSACEDDKTILVWDAARGELAHTLKAPAGLVRALAVSPDGRWLASASSPQGGGESALALWDLRRGREEKRLPHRLSGVYDLAFSPDGSRLAAGGLWGGRVQVWEVPGGKEVRAIDTRTELVRRLAFSPDGRMLATASTDRTVRLWELATGGERLVFRGQDGEVKALAFSPDGRALAAASPDGPVFLWDVGPLRQRRDTSPPAPGITHPLTLPGAAAGSSGRRTRSR